MPRYLAKDTRKGFVLCAVVIMVMAASCAMAQWDTSHLNDGGYWPRNAGGQASSSWMGPSGARECFAMIALPSASSVEAVGITWPFTGRKIGEYTLQYTTASNPDASTPSREWTTVGRFTVQDNSTFSGEGGAGLSYKRAMLSFAAVDNVTGIRILITNWDTSTEPAISEIEVYQSNASAGTDPLTMVEHWNYGGEGFTEGWTNLAPLGTPFEQNHLGAYADWGGPGVVDASYRVAAGEAWIAGSASSYVGVALGQAYTVDHVAVSSASDSTDYNRSAAQYTIEYTTDVNLDPGNPGASTWVEIGVWSNPLPKMLRKLFAFAPISGVTGIRVSVAQHGTSKNISVDELEVYGADEASVAIGAPDAALVNSTSTVTFPVTIAGYTINLTEGDVSIDHMGTAGGSVTVVDGTTNSPRVEVADVTGDGVYTISIAAGVATTLDGTTTSDAAGPSDAVTVDNTVPSVAVDALGTTTDSTPTLAGTAHDANGIAEVEVTVGGNTYAAVLDLGAGTWSVEWPAPLADGTYDVVAEARDNAGNTAAYTSTGAVTIDSSVPVFGDLTVTPREVKPGDSVSITFTVSKELIANPDVTIDGDGATFLSVDTTGVITYTYAYDIAEDAASGSPAIVITGVDTVGLSGSLANSTAFVIQIPVSVVAWPAALVLLGAAAVALGRKRGDQ